MTLPRAWDVGAEGGVTLPWAWDVGSEGGSETLPYFFCSRLAEWWTSGHGFTSAANEPLREHR